MASMLQAVYGSSKEAGILVDTPFDTLNETMKSLATVMTGYEDVFSSGEDNTPDITSELWAISLMNQVLEAKEQRNLPLPTSDDETTKYVTLLASSLSCLYKLGHSPADVEKLMELYLESTTDGN